MLNDSKAVIDASILAQTVIKEEYTELALKLIEKLESIYAPPLILYEIGNTLIILIHRKLITKEDALRKLRFLTAIPTLNIKEPTLDKVAEIAIELKTTFYDASYLTLALEIGVPLITADRKLCEKGKKVAETIHASEIT